MKKNDEKKILLFGDLAISTKVCEFLLNQEKIELVGVVIGNQNPIKNDPWLNSRPLKDFAFENGIPSYNFKNFINSFEPGSLDIGITCRFNRILRKEHFNLFKEKIINFHGGLLPEFGGLYSSCHTILEKSSIGGGTLHYIDEGIDTGEIIARCEFPVTKNDTTSTIFKKTQLMLFETFVKIFKNLLTGNIKTIQQKDLVDQGYPQRYYDKNSLLNKKEFFLEDNLEEIDIKVRAFDFPNQEPAFFTINQEKFFVRKVF